MRQVREAIKRLICEELENHGFIQGTDLALDRVFEEAVEEVLTELLHPYLELVIVQILNGLLVRIFGF